jgi:hypothetical protein
MWNRFWAVILLLSIALSVHGHSHSDKNDESELKAPIDTILYLHIALQTFIWGVLFPTGMVLGLIKFFVLNITIFISFWAVYRSHWHVPVQSVSLLLTSAGYVLGHKHGGRIFPTSLHGIAANFILIPLISQATLGVYLKLHIDERIIRPWAVLAHSILCVFFARLADTSANMNATLTSGKLFPLLGWCQMLFGAIVLSGYCNGGALGQCLGKYYY